MAGPALDRLKTYMAANHWVASRSDLIALGLTESGIDTWLESERLVSLFHGVYGFGRDIETTESAWRAALLVAGPRPALTGRTSCEGWGMVRTERTIPLRIQVASAGREAARFTGRSPALSRTRVEVVHRAFEDGKIVDRNGLTMTSPARTLIDFAVDATPVALKFAFLEACRLGFFQRANVDYCFRRMYGRRGAKKLRPLLALWVPELSRIRSVLEGMFLLAWAAGGRPMPQVNVRVCGYEVDCHWPRERLIVEFDGGAFHGDPLARRRDAVRDRVLRDAGYRVARFDYRAVKNSPEMVVAQVSKLLRERP